MTKSKKTIFKKTVGMMLSIILTIFAMSLVSCTSKKEDFYTQFANWQGTDGKVQIDFKTTAGHAEFGARVLGTLTIDGKEVKIWLYTSDKAQSFAIYKNINDEPNEWLSTNAVKCICLGDYTFENEVVTFEILYDFTGLKGENALLGKSLVCHKQEKDSVNKEQSGGIYEKQKQIY